MISFMITTGSLNSQDMIRILKQSRHDFSGKHLCDGYCVDIMCGGRNSWFCKTSLKICYVSLFECKGPSVLKTPMRETDDYKTRLKKYHVHC